MQRSKFVVLLTAACGLFGLHLSAFAQDAAAGKQALAQCAACHAVNAANGTVSYTSSTPTERQPRGFRIDPTGRFMVVSGEKSEMLATYAIDPASGSLRPVGRFPTGKGANWVEIVSFD